jgi:hypothetical protein
MIQKPLAFSDKSVIRGRACGGLPGGLGLLV